MKKLHGHRIGLGPLLRRCPTLPVFVGMLIIVDFHQAHDKLLSLLPPLNEQYLIPEVHTGYIVYLTFEKGHTWIVALSAHHRSAQESTMHVFGIVYI